MRISLVFLSALLWTAETACVSPDPIGYGPRTSFPAALRTKAAMAKGRTAETHLLEFRDVRSRAACRRILPRLRQVCERPFNAGSGIQILISDLDRDGRQDVAVRYQSLFECGSHGCATEAYRQLPNRGFVKTDLNAVTTGGILLCRRDGTPGISFSGSTNHHCFLLRSA